MDKKVIIKVLNLMLNKQDREEYTGTGLCNWAKELYRQNYISWSECNTTDLYISKNRPSKSSLDCILYPPRTDLYYWKPGIKAPRIRWIKKHLKRLS